MKKQLLYILIALFSISYESNAQSDLSIFTLQNLEGTWHIKATNFPMWLKGDKQNPTFNYTIIEKKGKQILLDEVEYLKNGKEKAIVGYDYPQNEINTKFVWRGKGLLRIAKSEWAIILMAEDESWAVIEFQKTLFTPAGIDIIFREKGPTEAVQEKVLQELLSRKIIGQKGDLVWL